MTPYQLEQCEVLRRIAERGKAMALSSALEHRYLDIFQHMLDEVQRLKESDNK